MKTLYTGFKGENNSSFKLVSKFSGDKLFLTNSFSGLFYDIDNLSGEYDTVFMFGIDKNLIGNIRIEKCAQKNNQLLYSSLSIEKIALRLSSASLSVHVSNVPTTYLCNEAYWHMLKKFHGNAIFIHIPSLKNITNDTMSSIVSALRAEA